MKLFLCAFLCSQQIELQLANSLATDQFSTQYLSESTIHSLFSLGIVSIILQVISFAPRTHLLIISFNKALQLCDGQMVSVSSTAFATARQILAIVYDSTCDSLFKLDSSAHQNAMVAGAARSALAFLCDLCLCCRGQPFVWLRGTWC